MTTAANTTNREQAQAFIQAEWKRRMDLVNDEKFRELCAKYAQSMGVTADEWNSNRAIILMTFANEMCRKENEEAAKA